MGVCLNYLKSMLSNLRRFFFFAKNTRSAVFTYYCLFTVKILVGKTVTSCWQTSSNNNEIVITLLSNILCTSISGLFSNFRLPLNGTTKYRISIQIKKISAITKCNAWCILLINKVKKLCGKLYKKQINRAIKSFLNIPFSYFQSIPHQLLTTD